MHALVYYFGHDDLIYPTLLFKGPWIQVTKTDNNRS